MERSGMRGKREIKVGFGVIFVGVAENYVKTENNEINNTE